MYCIWQVASVRLLKLVVPKSLQGKVLSALHNSVTAGHLGVRRPSTASSGDIIGVAVVVTLKNGAEIVERVHHEGSPKGSSKLPCRFTTWERPLKELPSTC